MKKFDKLYKDWFSEAVDQQNLPVDAQQPKTSSPNDVSVPSEDDVAAADEVARDTQTGLEENEKLLVDILLKITSVLKDYEISQHGGTSEITKKIDDLITDTREDVGSGKELNYILKSFVDRFDDVFTSHLQTNDLNGV